MSFVHHTVLEIIQVAVFVLTGNSSETVGDRHFGSLLWVEATGIYKILQVQDSSRNSSGIMAPQNFNSFRYGVGKKYRNGVEYKFLHMYGDD
jgi:hypothetical protein